MLPGVRAEICEEALRPFRQPLFDTRRLVGYRLHVGLGTAAHARGQHRSECVERRRSVVVGEPAPQFKALWSQERLFLHERGDGTGVVHVRRFTQAGDDAVQRARAERHTDEVPGFCLQVGRHGVRERVAGLASARIDHHFRVTGLVGPLMRRSIRHGARRCGHVRYLSASVAIALAA